MIFKRLSVFICPFLILIGLELLFFDIRLIYVIPIILTLVLLLFLNILIKEKILSWDFFYLAVLPFLLLYSTILFLFLLGLTNIRHFVIIIFVLILGLYLENIFRFFHHQLNYHAFALENLSALLNLLIFFLIVVNLNALSVFLNLPIWLLLIILIVILALLILQSFWINKILVNLRYVYLLIIEIVILEFFWALAFLPTNFYVNGIILTIIFYFIWGIFKAKLNDKLSKKIFWRYLIISSVLLLIIVLTSRWT